MNFVRYDDAEELEHICKLYNPHVMVKGSDYKNKTIVGSQYCKSIVFYDLVRGYSTSKIIENINNRK